MNGANLSTGAGARSWGQDRVSPLTPQHSQSYHVTEAVLDGEPAVPYIRNPL